MDVIKLLQSKKIRISLLVIGGLVVAFAIFGVGMAVGFKKANFSYRWGENYHKNFGGPGGGFFRDVADGDFIGAHGVAGQILSIAGPTLVIKGRDNVEKIVLASKETIIRRGRKTVSSSVLSPNDMIVVIGEPNDAGQITAKFIRLMPQRKLRK